MRALVVMALLWGGAGAGAAPPDVGAGRAHFAAGQTYYQQRRFHEAVGEFLEAYRLSAAIDLLYNIAVCYDALDDPGRATIYYQRYLAERPDARERPEIEASLYRMSSRVAKLLIEAPAASEVFVDGIAVEIAPPTPLPLTAGFHRIEARRAGTPIASVQLTAQGGLSQTVRLEIVETRAATPRKRRWLWPVVGAAAAVAAAALIAGIVVGTSRADFRQQGRSLCAQKSGCVVISLPVGRP